MKLAQFENSDRQAIFGAQKLFLETLTQAESCLAAQALSLTCVLTATQFGVSFQTEKD